MASLVKSKERVSEHGEVFTPSHIVLDMIALIPDSVWSDKSHVCLEPTCGNGNFVVEIIKKKISCGLTVEEACNTTFGMDIQADNILECRHRILEVCKQYETDSVKFFNLACIVVNNFFVVKDSLSYMATGKFQSKKFFDKDPTNISNDVGLKKFFKNTNAPQILTRTEKESIIKTTTEFLKKV
jgi:hypothetical protein